MKLANVVSLRQFIVDIKVENVWENSAPRVAFKFLPAEIGLWFKLIKEQEAFEKCWAHSPMRAVLHCRSPGVATVARRLRIDVHDDDDNDNDNA